jgi:serine/threonine protein kinase
MTDLLAGRYELRARISKGGMGAVWRASDHRLHRDVAVKLLHFRIAEDVDEVGSGEVAPLSGAGSYRLHVRPQGSVS